MEHEDQDNSSEEEVSPSEVDFIKIPSTIGATLAAMIPGLTHQEEPGNLHPYDVMDEKARAGKELWVSGWGHSKHSK